MPRKWKYEEGDKVVITQCDGHKYVGKIGVIKEVKNGNYDYSVLLNGDNYECLFFEYELRKLNHTQLIEDGSSVFVNIEDKIGKVVLLDLTNQQCEVEFSDDTMGVFEWEKIIVLEGEGEIEVESEVGRFERIAVELGKFTDMKNKQYGSSVDATYEMVKVLMERYAHDDENYLMPKSLLQHILLQVRMMDKINRLFNNPSGKGDSESPYKDLTGYSLIGVDMVERNK